MIEYDVIMSELGNKCFFALKYYIDMLKKFFNLLLLSVPYMTRSAKILILI